MLNPDMPAQEIRLHMGELSIDEMHLARAALRWADASRDDDYAALEAKVAGLEARMAVVKDIATVRGDEATNCALRECSGTGPGMVVGSAFMTIRAAFTGSVEVLANLIVAYCESCEGIVQHFKHDDSGKPLCAECGTRIVTATAIVIGSGEG